MKALHHDPRAITQARRDAGLSQYRLAKLLDRSRSLISEIEGGTRNAAPDLLRKMADIFGCDVADLQSRRETTAAAPVDVQQLRNEERAEPDGLSEVRR